jgi:hypothetical protein
VALAHTVIGMRTILVMVGWLLGLYLIARAVFELVVLDWGNPASYAGDWGGPSLAGVLAVHCGPGVIAAALMVWALARRRAATPR